MACGTPIVAFARGSVPELVEDARPVSWCRTWTRRWRPWDGSTGSRVPGVAGVRAAVHREEDGDDYLALYDRLPGLRGGEPRPRETGMAEAIRIDPSYILAPEGRTDERSRVLSTTTLRSVRLLRRISPPEAWVSSGCTSAGPGSSRGWS